MKIASILFCLFIFTLIQPISANRDLGVSLSMSNDGWNNSLIFIPSFVYQNKYIISQLGFGFNNSEHTKNLSSTNTEEQTSGSEGIKNNYNPVTLSLAFKLNLNKQLKGLYGLRITTVSGKYNNISIKNSSKISLTSGFVKELSKNFYLISMLDIYSTYTYEWEPEGLNKEDISGKTFFSGGRFSFVYTF